MKLTGNKIVSALITICCMANSYAEESSIELTTFVAGTPAKASEVNGNFESMKDYIDQLEAKIMTLENGGYNIPVYGDGELIGYSLAYPTFEAPYPKIKNGLGIFAIDSYKLNETGEFSLRVPDAVKSYNIVFNTPQCNDITYIIYDLAAYKTLITPRDITSRDYLLTGSLYFIAKGTNITKNVDPSNYYMLDNEQTCIAVDLSLGDTVIPLQPMPDNFKFVFESLTFGEI